MTSQQRSQTEYSFTTASIPASRALVVDAGILASKRHVVYGLLEADVTEARSLIKTTKDEEGNSLSFTSYLVACLSRAIAEDPSVQAIPSKKKLIIFKDVDVVTMIEPSEGAVAIPHIIRNANQKSVQEISQEIRAVQNRPETSQQCNTDDDCNNNNNKKNKNHSLVKLAPKIPRWLRMLFFSMVKRNPKKMRDMQGTVILTSVGMFGRKGSSGWGITYLPLHTLGITIGGIQIKPRFLNPQQEIVCATTESSPMEQQLTSTCLSSSGTTTTNPTVVPREILNISVAFDHDIVDGAPAARFAGRLVEWIETTRLLKSEQPHLPSYPEPLE